MLAHVLLRKINDTIQWVVEKYCFQLNARITILYTCSRSNPIKFGSFILLIFPEIDRIFYSSKFAIVTNPLIDSTSKILVKKKNQSRPGYFDFFSWGFLWPFFLRRWSKLISTLLEYFQYFASRMFSYFILIDISWSSTKVSSMSLTLPTELSPSRPTSLLSRSRFVIASMTFAPVHSKCEQFVEHWEQR